MARKTSLLALVLCAGLAAPAAPAPAGEARARHAHPVVIAILEPGGMNVLHEDFLASRKLALPPGAPSFRRVELPESGGFDARISLLQRGPLGDPEPGTLYGIEDTRLLVYFPSDRPGISVLDERTHGTGVASAAVGRTFGTAPEAVLVFVPSTSPKAWEWVSKQRWIDIVSTSYYGLASTEGNCYEGKYVKRILDQGRMVFSASGNAEHLGTVHAPAGVPEAYQVGGVDAEGRTYLPTSSDPDEVELALVPTRPYETGDRFDFDAASPDALQGASDFGGTSGAAPSTAGRAATLIGYARSLVGDRPDRALVRAARRRTLPERGPLADGRLTNTELVDLLHHVARPAEPAGPTRYLVEGYGALNADAVGLARNVIAAIADEPKRPEEDEMHATEEDAKSAAFYAGGRCS